MSGELSNTDVALTALLEGGDPDAAIEAYQAEVEESPSILESMTTPSEEAIEESTQDESNQDVEQAVSGVADDGESESIESVDAADTAEQRIIEVKAGGRKLNVDLNDEEKVSKYVKMAMGARKWQAERDEAREQYGKVSEELTELRNFEETIQSGWESNGVRGVISTLAGDESKFEEFMESEYQRRRAKEDASPAELELLETREKLDNSIRQRELFEKKQLELTEREETGRVEAEKTKYQNLMNPAFQKWRMSGKLGDASLESDMDSLIWEKARAELKKVPVHVELTSRVVEREFRKASTALRKVVDSQTNTKVKKVMAKTKAEAQNKAAMAATRGLPKANDDTMDARAREAISSSSNTMEAFTKFFK